MKISLSQADVSRRADKRNPGLSTSRRKYLLDYDDDKKLSGDFDLLITTAAFSKELCSKSATQEEEEQEEDEEEEEGRRTTFKQCRTGPALRLQERVQNELL